MQGQLTQIRKANKPRYRYELDGYVYEIERTLKAYPNSRGSYHEVWTAELVTPDGRFVVGRDIKLAFVCTWIDDQAPFLTEGIPAGRIA